MNYDEFLAADILCLLHDYGPMTAKQIAFSLGLDDDDDITDALDELVVAGKVKKNGRRFAAIDELTAHRFKKTLPQIF